MGTSTDAILVYGIECGEDCVPEFMEGFDDFDDYLDDLSGLPKWGEAGHDFVKQKAFRESFPVSMTMHCSYEYPMYIVAVRGTETIASRGYANEITSIAVDEEKISAFKEFCEKNGIEGQPKWLLCSMWG